MSPRRALALCIGVAIAASSARATAQPAPAFAVQSIPSKGRVLAAEIADLDGDGRRELLSITSRGVTPDERREIQVRRVETEGRVAEAPAWTAPLPPGAAGYDLADLDGAPGDELLLLERDGVAVLSRAGGHTNWRRLRVATPPTVAVGGDERGLDRLRLARPELGRGRLLVPGLGEAWLLGANGEALARLAVGGRANFFSPLRPGPEIGESEIQLYFDVPSLQTADVDGDGRTDVVATNRHGLRVFRQRADGSFPAEPDQDLAFHLIGLDDQVRNTGTVSATVVDLDRDGRADLVVSHTSGGLLRAESQTRIHRNRGGTFDLAHPDREFERSGGMAADEIIDLDGDGRPELLRVFVPLGLLQVAELFLQRSVDLEASIYRPDPEGHFERDPWLVRTLSMRLDFESLRPTGFADTLAEDWNRDGQRDWLSSADGKAVEVRLGGPSFRFASAQSRDPLDSAGRVTTGDLDGDGLPDFVVFDPRRSDAPILAGVNLGRLPGSPPRISPAR